MSPNIWLPMPGVPAAGHVVGGFWHPGRVDGCPKCEEPPRPCPECRRPAGSHKLDCSHR